MRRLFRIWFTVRSRSRPAWFPRDEREHGERRKLNFGHTFGHALEKLTGIAHGEAVGIGMVIAAKLSVEKGLLASNEARRLERIVHSYGLPVRPARGCFLHAGCHEKKTRSAKETGSILCSWMPSGMPAWRRWRSNRFPAWLKPPGLNRSSPLMRYLFIEPFFGGSHQDFAQGLVAHSRHDIQLVTLPARFWKWRMRGAALHFVRAIDDLSAYDGIITSGLMSLSDFTALYGSRRPPTLVYFHENQLTYPLAPGERMDMQFGFTDITTALCADRILFNSRFHFDQFFSALPGFISRMPEFKPRWAVAAIRKKADVLHPGCHLDATPARQPPLPPGPPLIVWNHRWEFDKNPEAFFSALDRMDRMGIDFRVALLGENYQARPKVFVAAKSRFGEKIVQYGFVESKSDYLAWLKRGGGRCQYRQPGKLRYLRG
jgi:glycosyltransferase involved in cell wall biosynthesis